MSSPIVNLRMSPDVIAALDELVHLTGKKSRAAFVCELILAEHDRVMGNPKLKALVEQLRDVQHVLEGFQFPQQSP